MSEVKVNKITPTADCGTVTLGDSGDTVAIPAGVTLTSGGALQNSGTITNTGTITGVSITGTIDNQVNWQTTVKTTGFTATAGEGYFCNTTSGAFTVTLPASPSAGDLVGIKDYANTADTNNITIGRNGSNIEGVANDFVINIEGGSITLIYVDATKGWLSTAAAKASDITEQAEFVAATGGTITTCGNFKIHTFTGPGTFSVSSAGNSAGSNVVDYLVVAGGGGGGAGTNSGGAGAGGFRASATTYTNSGPSSPRTACVSALPVSVQGYPITVGAGGVAGDYNPCGVYTCAPTRGANSIFSTKTSTGGGTGAPRVETNTLGPGGSGGGDADGGGGGGAGTGNTPPVSPSQGSDGQGGAGSGGGGNGGGGFMAVGTLSRTSPINEGGPGGAGGGIPSAMSTTGEPSGGQYYYAGGGGAGAWGAQPTPFAGGQGGLGGGGNGNNNPRPGGAGPNATAGGTNQGGAGGGGGGTGGNSTSYKGSNGGSGVVVIRYKFQ